MGILFSRSKKANSAAIGTFRHVGKETEVIELDKEVIELDKEVIEFDENVIELDEEVIEFDEDVIELDREVENGGVSEDSRIEEVEVIEDDEPDVVELDAKWLYRGAQPSPSSIDEVDVSNVSAYKNLLESVERQRTLRLKQLDLDIEILERQRSFHQSLRSKKKSVKEVLCEPFIPLTEEEEELVKWAFSTANWRILVIHENSNIEITGEVLQCLRPGAWLNDEVINVYLELLKEREKREPQKFLYCHFFNTFFYKKLISGSGYDYKSVRRWTSQRKLGYGLLNCDKIFVPVYKEIHWCLAVINKKEQKFQYLDSLKGRDTKVMEVLARYYVDEVKDKSGVDISLSSWEREYVEDIPEQKNGCDCGMFMIKYADFYSRGSGLFFSQEHMPYFRRRTAKEILKLRAD